MLHFGGQTPDKKQVFRGAWDYNAPLTQYPNRSGDSRHDDRMRQERIEVKREETSTPLGPLNDCDPIPTENIRAAGAPQSANDLRSFIKAPTPTAYESIEMASPSVKPLGVAFSPIDASFASKAYEPSIYTPFARLVDVVREASFKSSWPGSREVETSSTFEYCRTSVQATAPLSLSFSQRSWATSSLNGVNLGASPGNFPFWSPPS